MVTQRGHEYGVFHFFSAKTGLLSEILALEASLSHEHIQELLHLGSVYVDHNRQIEDLTLPLGSYIRVHTKPRRFLAVANLQTDLVANEKDFLVIHKPAGLPVHDSVDNIRENLLRILEKELQIRLFITHRLDVPTEGLILYAKTPEFQKKFNEALTKNRTRKVYRAELLNPHGDSLTPSILTHYMKKSFRAPKEVVNDPLPETQTCQLQILNIETSLQNNLEVEIDLLTGRTHQIRAQMSHVGYPVVNDVLYGAPQIYPDNKIHLTAQQLQFQVDSINYDFRTKKRW